MEGDFVVQLVLFLVLFGILVLGCILVVRDGHKAKASAVPPQTSGDDSKIFDTENWLSEHGLGEYYDALVENDVTTPEALKRLDEDDLREIGVASLGHRKRFLDGILSLNQPNRIAYAALILGVVSLFLSEFWPIPAAALIVGIWGYQVSKRRSGE